MAQYKVIGDRAVGGVQPGGVVELDPAVTNVTVLLGRRIEEIHAEPDEDPVLPEPVKASKVRRASATEGGAGE